MSRTKYKHLPKWKLSKFYHNKLMHELQEAKEVETEEVMEKTPEQEQKELLDLFDDPSWLYDNMLISYEELQKRKNNAR